MKRYKYTKDQLEEIVRRSTSYRDLLLKLGMAGKGGNYKTIQARIEREEIDVSHFTGMGWRKGRELPSERKDISEVLIENSVYSSGAAYSSWKIKGMLLREGLKENKCEECGTINWNNKELKFELHHINGNSKDNRLDNLQILCPNCHSQTNNFRNKNKYGGTQLTEVHGLENR